MTATVSHQIPRFIQCQPTTEDLDYVSFTNLDLSEFDNPITRSGLANQLLNGCTTHGFFTITNHGIPADLQSSQVDLAHAVLSLTVEEKKAYQATPTQDAQGLCVGYKPSGVLDKRRDFHKTVDHYNIPTSTPDDHAHPPILLSQMDQVSHVTDLLRENILRKLLVLVAEILEVPEETLLSTHASDTGTTDYLRYTIYSPRSEDDSRQYRDLYLPGHTDWGSFTFLFSQPVSALQVRLPSGEWRWVQYVPGALIVNVGEALELLTGGLFRAPVHRVVKPPADQERATRIGVIYFARPADDQRLEPIDSPTLRRLGIDKPLDETIYTMKAYLYARKHGYKRLKFDQERPPERETSVDFIKDIYTDPGDSSQFRVKA